MVIVWDYYTSSRIIHLCLRLPGPARNRKKNGSIDSDSTEFTMNYCSPYSNNDYNDIYCNSLKHKHEFSIKQKENPQHAVHKFWSPTEIVFYQTPPNCIVLFYSPDQTHQSIVYNSVSTSLHYQPSLLLVNRLNQWMPLVHPRTQPKQPRRNRGNNHNNIGNISIVFGETTRQP
jgi:hypothetical protein